MSVVCRDSSGRFWWSWSMGGMFFLRYCGVVICHRRPSDLVAVGVLVVVQVLLLAVFCFSSFFVS